MLEAGLVFTASHSATPGGQQDPRAETEEARDSANSAYSWGGGGEFTSYSFWAGYFLLNFINQYLAGTSLSP